MRSAAMQPSMQCDLSRNDDAYNSKFGKQHVREQHREHNLGALPGHGSRRPDHYMNYMGPKAAASRATTKSRNQLQVPPPPPSYAQEIPSGVMLSRRLAPLARDGSETEHLGADVSSSAGMLDCRQYSHMDSRSLKLLSSQSTGNLLADVEPSNLKPLSASVLRVGRSQVSEQPDWVELNGSREHGMVHSRSDTWLDVRSVDSGKRRIRGTRSSACPAPAKLPCITASPVKISGSSITVAKGTTKSSPLRPQCLLDGSWSSWETPAAMRPVFDRGHGRRRSRGVAHDISMLACSASEFLR